MHARLRIGVVGAGPVLDRYHMSAINAVPEVVRSIVVDVDGTRARRAADRYGFPRWSTDLRDLVETSDAALVLVPNGQHAPVCCELLSQGIHTLCEKPMAPTIDECLRMIGASHRSGARLCVGHNRRFRKHVELARKCLSRGLIGALVRIEAEEGSPQDWPRSPAYFDPARAGGGALIDVGIHSIDLIRWLAGEFQELEYSGNGSETMVESEAELRFGLASGADGRVLSSRTRFYQQRITIVGTDGFLEIGLWEPTLQIRCARGKAFQNFDQLQVAVSRRPPLDASFVDQLRNFVGAIRGQGHLLVDGQEGMAAVEVVCRAYGRTASRNPSFAHALGTGD